MTPARPAAPQRRQATRPPPPLKRASPVAPLARAARREASAQTASTPAPLETSSAMTALTGPRCPAQAPTLRRAVPLSSQGRHSNRDLGRVGNLAPQLRLEALPPLRIRALAGVRRGGPASLLLKRVELAQHHPRLDRAVPVVDLEPHRGVDRVLRLDPERGAAEGDAEGAVRAAVEAEAGVLALLPHRPHVADPRRGNHQPHARVAHPERGQLPQFLGQIEAEAEAADHRVDPLGPSQLLGAEQARRVGGEGATERLDVRGSQREARRGPVATEALQVRQAGPQRRPAGRTRGCCAHSPAPSPLRRAR